ncbi:hypothetical protein RCL1_008776 [Eukaryota sp. TZLM3-RCL]
MSSIFTGFLRGGLIKSWKRRFFVVNPNYEVDYYESMEAYHTSSANRKGTISCRGLKVIVNPHVPQRPFQFELRGGNRNWILAADSHDEKVQWVNIFRTCCGEVQHQVMPQPQSTMPSVQPPHVQHQVSQPIVLPQQPMVSQPMVQPQFNMPNIPDLVKKLKTTGHSDEKHRVLNSYLSSVSTIILTPGELLTIVGQFPADKDHRITVFEQMATFVAKFTVEDVVELLGKMSGKDAKLKAIDIVSYKLIYSLPWDCEPIYKALSSFEDKNTTRDLIKTRRAMMGTVQEPVLLSTIPTVEMLIDAVTKTGHSKEKVNVLECWMASVVQPVFYASQVEKLLGAFTASDDYRINTLQAVFNFLQPYNVEECVGIMNKLPNQSARMNGFSVLASKLVYNCEWDCEEIFKLFTSSKDKEGARTMLQSLRSAQQEQMMNQQMGVLNLVV